MPMQNAFRPALAPSLCLVLGIGLSACGELDEPVRFQTLAERVAAIPVDGSAPDRPYPRTAQEAGLRPAPPLQVAVMEPHDMWDARDQIVEGAVRRAVPVMAPVAADVASREVRRRVGAAMPSGTGQAGRYLPRRPADPLPPLRPAEAPTLRNQTTTVQLGAYSSYSAAQAAWSRLSRGDARAVLGRLSPVYEPVDVQGRELVRLKVRAPVGSAQSICAAARVSDTWCYRG